MKHDTSAGGDTGLVTAAFGRHYEITTEFGTPVETRIKCVPRGKKSQYACGDEAVFSPSGEGQGVITGLAPRRNLLWRSDAFREKLIAANLDLVVIVVATEPGFSDLFISRCLIAAEHQRIDTLIVLNKADLSDRLDAARAQLQPFVALGHEALELSALEDADPLRPLLAGRRSILVGQSGMGKSTLINTLIPEAEAATREISEALDSGKHTTTFARLYSLKTGGSIIDSPGMQAFGLAHVPLDELPACFPEFRPWLGHCRFRDCKHEAEPGCALTAALERGDIHPRRFEHFRLIRSEIEYALGQRRGW